MTKEIFTSLFEDERILIEEIDSFGAESDDYNKDHDEWVYLLKGEAIIEIQSDRVF